MSKRNLWLSKSHDSFLRLKELQRHASCEDTFFLPGQLSDGKLDSFPIELCDSGFNQKAIERQGHKNGQTGKLFSLS